MKPLNFPQNKYQTDDLSIQKVIELNNPKTTTHKINERLTLSFNYSHDDYFNSNGIKDKNETTNHSSDDEGISIQKQNEEIDSSLNQSYYGNINLSLQSQSLEILFLVKKKFFLCNKKERPSDKESEDKIEKSNRTERRFDDERTNFVRQSLNCYLNEEVLSKINGENPKEKIIKLKKFPEKFIAKVALISNKKYLDKKLISLYEESKLYEKEDNNKKSRKITLDEIKDKQDVKELLEMTLKQLADKYLKSNKFTLYYQKLENTKGIDKAEMFRFCGKYFAGYILL